MIWRDRAFAALAHQPLGRCDVLVDVPAAGELHRRHA
jgi:hypothetical protein